MENEKKIDNTGIKVENMNIYQRMNAISDEVGYVNKNLQVKFGQGTYKAVGEADILSAVKPLEKKYGVFSFPINREIIQSERITASDGRITYFERIKVTYRFVNSDKTDEFLEVISFGDGIDPADKSVGKAMTYADKYALMKAYKIMTGEDPDQEGSDSEFQDSVPFHKQMPQNGTQTPRQATGASSGGNYAPLPQNASVGPKNVAMASLKQIGLLKKLMSERNLADISGKQPDQLTSEEASKAIDELTASPKTDDNAKLHARIKAVLTGGLSTKATAEFLDFLSKKGYGSEADVSDTRTLLALANNLEEKLAKEKSESVKPLSDNEMPF